MKLNHINLFSHDIDADRIMFERHFGLKTRAIRGRALVIMEDEAGMVLILSHFRKNLGSFSYPASFEIFHIGFLQPTKDAVDTVHRRLHADGWITQEPHQEHGAWKFYFMAKGGYTIEVATMAALPEPVTQP